jgi:putative glutamine amidotransferase
VGRPVVGLNCGLWKNEQGSEYWRLDRRYPDAVQKAGGDPLILPFAASRQEARAWLERVDAVIFTGGLDIHPSRWGETEVHPKAKLLPKEKEDSDFYYAKAAIARDMPILGICLGSQLVNVALGGKLHQHIGDDHSDGKHRVRVSESRLRELLRKVEPEVNTFHHQAVSELGKGLRVTATAEDGTIEATESDKHRWIVNVQWHPERMADRPEQAALFRALVAQATR